MADDIHAAASDVTNGLDNDGDRRVVRDSTFSRAVADEVMPLMLGRDIELSFLQISPLFTTLLDKGDHYLPNGEATMAEVARVRISYAKAVSLAMDIIRSGIVDDRIRGDVVAASIVEWRKEAEATGDAESVDAD